MTENPVEIVVEPAQPDVQVVVEPALPEVLVNVDPPESNLAISVDLQPEAVVVETQDVIPDVVVEVAEIGLVGPPGPPGAPGETVVVGGVSQDDLHNHVISPTPHPVYDDGPSLSLLYQNAKV